MFPADANDLRRVEPVQYQVPTATLLWVQRPGKGRVSLKGFQLMLMMLALQRVEPVQ